MSIALHVSLISAAIALTSITPTNAAETPKEPDIIYVPARPQEPLPMAPQTSTASQQTAQPRFDQIVIVPPSIPETTLPPIATDARTLDDANVIIGHGNNIGGTSSLSGITGVPGDNGVVDAQVTDRAPSIVGIAPAPRYPAALRQAGTPGRVTARFVVDTLGRTEMDGLTLTESTHPLFGDAVRNALQQYRFAPGEISGRKVRTMVQMPFVFTIK